MYNSTVELDDEDTINEHRRQIVSNPDNGREEVVRTKMRATLDFMNAVASRILNMEVTICKNETSKPSEHGTSRLIADTWQIVMKMICDEEFRTTANINELEEYTNMLGAHARLIKQTMTTFESLVNSRYVSMVEKLPTIKQFLSDQGDEFLKLVIEFHNEIRQASTLANKKH